MEKSGISSEDIIKLDICGERTTATRSVLTQVSDCMIASIVCCFLLSLAVITSPFPSEHVIIIFAMHPSHLPQS